MSVEKDKDGRLVITLDDTPGEPHWSNWRPSPAPAIIRLD
jgi:hypothetical protein